MDLEKIKAKIEAADVVEELLALSDKIFEKNSDDVKSIIETIITKSYLMGKKNMVKTFDA